MDQKIDSQVISAIVDWAKLQMAAQRVPRVMLKLRFGTPALAAAVQGELARLNGPQAHYVVRASSQEDAVRCRNSHGVSKGARVLYLCFWAEGVDGHSRNAQSLADLRAVTITDFLGKSSTFVLEAEKRILERAPAAAAVFGNRAEMAAGHLRDAFNGLRFVLREMAGGREGSLPYVSSLERYVDFLRRAHIDDATWAAIPPEVRAFRYVLAWGEALPALGMFRTPALSWLLGIPVQAADTVPKKEQAWSREFAVLLAENLDAAADHEALKDAIAGHETVEDQLRKLGARYPLCQDEAARPQAQEALLRFLHEGNEQALTLVEWLFRKDRANKRSEALGLRGLLTVRRAGRRRVSPVEAAIAATELALRSSRGDSAGTQILAEHLRTALVPVQVRPIIATALHGLIQTAMAGGQLVDATWGLEFSAALGPEPMTQTQAQAALTSWARLAKRPDDPKVPAPMVLVGLARLLTAMVRDGEGETVRVPEAAGGALLLRVDVPGPKKAPPHRLVPDALDHAAFDALGAWLRDVAFAGVAASGGEEEGEGGEETDGEWTPKAEVRSIEVAIEAGGGKPEVQLGEIDLTWLEETVAALGFSRSDVPRTFRIDAPPGRAFAVQARLAFREDGAVAHVPVVVADALAAFDKSLGMRESAWDAAFMAAPVNTAGRQFVQAWYTALGEVGVTDTHAALAQLKAELKKAIASDDQARVDELMSRMDEIAKPARPALGTKDVQALLGCLTGVLGEQGPVPNAVALSPFHPIVLRSRAIVDDIVASILARLWTDGWPRAGLRDLEAFLEDFGMPEPVHAYGGSWDGEPLVFDSWSDEGRSALFVRKEDATGSDLATLGIARALDEIRRYLALFPAAGDRLRVRVHADPQMVWARNFARAFADELPVAGSADLDIVTSAVRAGGQLERWAEDSEALGQALVLGEDGSRPRLRIRVVDESAVEDAHLALVVGPTQPLLRGTLQPVAPPHVAERDCLSVEGALVDPVPRATENALHMGAPRSGPELRLARAVSYGAGQGNDVWVERYSFDASVLAKPIAAIHRRAHWLVLLGREPLHRALEVVGSDVVVLLDYGESRDHGRPLHHATSVGREQFEADLLRLQTLLREVLGDDADPEKMLDAARAFAPGLAIQCIAAGTRIALHGLLGLLLTGEWVRSAAAAVPTVALALDQCRRLLGDEAAMRADVLVVRSQPDAIELSLAESKFTMGTFAGADGAVADARAQLAATRTRLARLCCEHPLAALARADLRAALAHQADLRQPAAVALLQRIENGSPIRLAPEADAAVCLYAPTDEAGRAFDTSAGAARVVAFGKNDVKALFLTMTANV